MMFSNLKVYQFILQNTFHRELERWLEHLLWPLLGRAHYLPAICLTVKSIVFATQSA